MEKWLKTDWAGLFRPEMSLPEILIRGSLVYIALCLLLRVILKRQAGKVSLSDLLVVTLVAGVCRNPLVRDTQSIPDGLAVVTVILFWSFVMDWLSYNSPFIHKLVHPPPVQLIRDGEVLMENLHQELMTENQLHCQLRHHGLKEPAQVAEAWMEGSGHVSVIKKEDDVEQQHERSAGPGNQDAPALHPGAPGISLFRTSNGGCENSSVLTGRADGTAGTTPLAHETVDADVCAFLDAAAKLQRRLSWHEEQIAVHQGSISRLRNVLGRYGLTIKRAARSRISPGAEAIATDETRTEHG